ncbi:MAG: hypothetical protein JNJ89_15940 [Rubrivivax sp.]|nr:hypothetical protein [Rubrivivax sp.]
MKLLRPSSVLIAAAATLVAAAGCGVGNDEETAGSLTPLTVVPSSTTLTGPNSTTCGGGFVSRVYVNGGAGPYEIRNSLPGVLVVSTSQVEKPGDFFDVDLPVIACMTSIPILVIDKWGRQVTYTVSSVKGS